MNLNSEAIETILRCEFIGEMKGFGQALELMNKCVVFCESENKNYVDGDKLMALIKERKKMLLDRFERGRNF